MLDQTPRQRWMALLAKAPAEELDESWSRLEGSPGIPAFAFLRRPEIGLTLVRGRIGGDGAAFNLGEMTLTRCSVRLASGVVGHAWIAGRRKQQAERAAILDAMLQESPLPSLHAELDWLEARQAARRLAQSRKSAATKVEFFTLVRGEDPAS